MAEGKSNNVFKLHPSSDVAETLRLIADQIDSGEVVAEGCTLVINGWTVYAFGSDRVPEHVAAREAVFDLNVAIHKLMQMTFEGVFDR